MSEPSYHINSIMTFYVNTHDASGAEGDADAAPTYRVYEEQTTAPILTGTMALLDAANTAGFYSGSITLSAANGFERGKGYVIRIRAVISTVPGITLREFRIDEWDYPTGAVVTDAGNSATSFKTNLVETGTTYWNRSLILFMTGALAGQQDRVSTYNGSTKIVGMQTGYTATPASGDVFLIINR